MSRFHKRVFETEEALLEAKNKKQKIASKFPVPKTYSDYCMPEDINGIKKALDENGFVVIAKALTIEQCSEAENLFWKYIETTYPKIKRANLESWYSSSWPDATVDKGILSKKDIAHSDYAWFLRQNVAQLFSNIWDIKNLITSFDNVGAFRPLRDLELPAGAGRWYHMDQNLFFGKNNSGFKQWQGIVDIKGSNATSGGLIVVPGSHKKFPEIMEANVETFEQIERNWAPLKDSDIKKYCKNAVKVITEPGDLILFDSRLIHCNCPPQENKFGEEKELQRLLGYVCMVPALYVEQEAPNFNFTPESLWMSRLECAYKKFSTSHSPHLNMAHIMGSGHGKQKKAFTNGEVSKYLQYYLSLPDWKQNLIMPYSEYLKYFTDEAADSDIDF